MINWIVSLSILIICVVLIRWLLKGRISPGLQYALWGIVLLRLLIPGNFGNSRISVENFTDNITEVYENEATWEVMNYDEEYMAEADYSFNTGDNNTKTAVGSVETVATAVAGYEEAEAEVAQSESREPKVTIAEVLIWLNNSLGYIWVAGMLVTAGVFLYTNVRFGMTTAKGGELIVEKKKWKLPVYYSDNVATSCLYGVVNPKIYVNAEAIAEDSAFRHVMEHELTHYRHGDNIWCILRFIALAVHWYNPLVWLAAFLSKKDSELACDAGTIKRLGEMERVGYGMTLINMSCKRKENIFAMATTMAGSKKSIQERITFIARKPKTAMRTLIVVLLVVLMIIGITFTGAVGVVELPYIEPVAKELSNVDLPVTEPEMIKTSVTGEVVESNGVQPEVYYDISECYHTIAGVSYVMDVYDRIMYGTEDSFVAIYADRTGMPFRLIEAKDSDNPLVNNVYDMYNSEGLEITYYDSVWTARETYASYSPNNAERLIELINQYNWTETAYFTSLGSDYMVEVNSGGGLFKGGYMRFYDIGDGMVVCKNGRDVTYWKADAKERNSVSIAEQLKADYDNIELKLTCVEIGGCADEHDAFDYLVDEIYPATRCNLKEGDPYRISNYRLRGAGRETTKGKQVREGSFTFECIPEGETETVEKEITFTVEATDKGTWIFRYYDSDKN